ncbi:MAG: insulinase family protein, partial [Parvibaculales bacterium]
MRVIFALLLLCTSLPVALAAPPVKVVKNANGLTAWLVKDKNLPLINIKMAWRGGARADPPKAAGLTALLAKLLTQGAGDMAATQFQVALDEHAIRLSFSADDDYVTGSLRCLSQYQAR